MVSFTLYAVKFLLIYRHLQNTYWFKCDNSLSAGNAPYVVWADADKTYKKEELR